MDNVDIQNLTKNVELDKKIKKFSKNNKLKQKISIIKFRNTI